MSPNELLATLRSQGVILTARGDRLRVDAPATTVTPKLRAELREFKTDLLRLLNRESPGPSVQGISKPVYGVYVYETPTRDAAKGGFVDATSAMDPQTPSSVDRPATHPKPTSAPRFRYRGADMKLGDVCAGWTPEGWAAELQRKADRCEEYRPDIAAYYRAWAADIEGRLPAEPDLPFVEGLE